MISPIWRPSPTSPARSATPITRAGAPSPAAPIRDSGSRAAQNAGAPTLGRRRQPGRRFPLRGICARSGGPRLDVRRIRFRHGRRARLRAKRLARRDIRCADQDRIGGGLVDEMPMEPYRTDPDLVWSRKSVEVVWNDRQERELLDAGLIPLPRSPTPTNWKPAPPAAR